MNIAKRFCGVCVGAGAGAGVGVGAVAVVPGTPSSEGMRTEARDVSSVNVPSRGGRGEGARVGERVRVVS